MLARKKKSLSKPPPAVLDAPNNTRLGAPAGALLQQQNNSRAIGIPNASQQQPKSGSTQAQGQAPLTAVERKGSRGKLSLGPGPGPSRAPQQQQPHAVLSPDGVLEGILPNLQQIISAESEVTKSRDLKKIINCLSEADAVGVSLYFSRFRNHNHPFQLCTWNK
jgi:hypothetical protein